MRAFITAITILCLTVILIIFNCVYTNKTIDPLLESLANAEAAQASEKDIDAFEALWKKSRGFLILSTNQNHIIKIDSLINAMRICMRTKDISGYQNSVSLLRDTLLEIKRFEELSISNII